MRLSASGVRKEKNPQKIESKQTSMHQVVFGMVSEFNTCTFVLFSGPRVVQGVPAIQGGLEAGEVQIVACAYCTYVVGNKKMPDSMCGRRCALCAPNGNVQSL